MVKIRMMERRFVIRCSWSLLGVATLWAMSARYAEAAAVTLDVRAGELKQALSDFLKIKKYMEDLTAARERGESVKPPSLNRIPGGESALKRLDDLLKSIENFSIPPEVAPGAPAAPTLGGVLSARSDSELRQVVHAGVSYLAEMYQRTMKLKDTGKRLRELQKTAEAVREATVKIQDMFITLYEVPLEGFDTAFGFPAEELLTAYIPKISAIASEAKATDDRIAKEFETRVKHINNLGQNLYTLLEEESRRFNERSDRLLQTRDEILKLADTLQADTDRYNAKVERDTPGRTRCLRHSEKVIAYQQARAQLDAEMNADLYGAGLWYGKYEQRIKVLDAQEATLIQEANGLKSVCSDIAKRDKEFDVVDKQFKARSKEITDMRQRLESDINQFNKPLKAANADRAWLESVGNWRRQSRE